MSLEPPATVFEQEGMQPVDVRIGEFVWLMQDEAGLAHPSLVLLERSTARRLAEHILRVVPA